jgi:hypothetical protein
VNYKFLIVGVSYFIPGGDIVDSLELRRKDLISFF